MSKYTEDDLKIELETKEYEYGFYTDIESETFPIGLNEDIVRAISQKKGEPQWMTDWRLEAFHAWQLMIEPEWANVHYTKPDFQAISYYSAPKAIDPNKTLDDVDPELRVQRLHVALQQLQRHLPGDVTGAVVGVDGKAVLPDLAATGRLEQRLGLGRVVAVGFGGL